MQVYACTQEVQEEGMALVEGQDVSRFKEPGLEYEDIGCLEDAC